MLTIGKNSQNIIGSGNKQKNLQCLQPRKLSMNANAKLCTCELVCFTLAITHFFRSRSLSWFSCVSPLEYAFTVLHV